MNRHHTKRIEYRKEPIGGWILSVSLGVAVWLFFGIFYRHHLHYQEQFQLFLTTSGYLAEVISLPGGFAVYAGRFFTQFYQDSIQGAFLLAGLLVALQRLVADAADFIALRPIYRPLTCIPALGMWAMLCDEHMLLSSVIAPLTALLAVAFYNRIAGEKIRMGYVLIMTPLIYILAGLAGFIFPALSLLTEWMGRSKEIPLRRAIADCSAGDLFVSCGNEGRQTKIRRNGKTKKRSALSEKELCEEEPSKKELSVKELSEKNVSKQETSKYGASEKETSEKETSKKETSKTVKTTRIAVTAATILLAVLLPLAAKAVFLQYPLSRLIWAGDYYRFVSLHPAALLGVFLSIIVLPVSFRWLPAAGWSVRSLSPKSSLIAFFTPQRLMIVVQLLLTAGLGYIGISHAADWKKEEVMAYDYYARTGKWNRIIALADRTAPDGPLTVATLNLSLCQEGLLPDYMFTYFQNGPEGLLPAFERDFTSPLMVGEIYYHLGLINTAQRYAFEAMEALPDHQKSVRCIKRLAETNLINGAYAVAVKYLKILEHTLFYRTWARETLACLNDEARIEAHPEWGKLRRLRPQEDFLFSEVEKDMMLGLLFQQNQENRMAYEYLLAYTLLTKDLSHFLTYYRMGEQTLAYPVIPKSYQEALLYIWHLTHAGSAQSVPYPIDDTVKRRLASFLQSYRKGTAAEPLLRASHPDTYWYYYHFRRN